MTELGFELSLLSSFIKLSFSPILETIADLQGYGGQEGSWIQWAVVGFESHWKFLSESVIFFHTVHRIFCQTRVWWISSIRRKTRGRKCIWGHYSHHLESDGVCGNESTHLCVAFTLPGSGSSLASPVAKSYSLSPGPSSYLLYFFHIKIVKT